MPALVKFTATIHRFDKQGEKTGWTYIEIPADLAAQLKPGNKQGFKVKGRLDAHPIRRVSLLPMGGGKFILALNAALRKAIGKKKGAMLKAELLADNSEFVFNGDFIACLKDEPPAWIFFQSLTGSHQRYFSKWIDEAKTEPTKIKRITMAVNALAKKWGYNEMLRAQKKNPLSP
ncbi:MAG: YdeI/OmpD-associated family protein [Chitinophagaceae bacterium]